MDFASHKLGLDKLLVHRVGEEKSPSFTGDSLLTREAQTKPLFPEDPQVVSGSTAGLQSVALKQALTLNVRVCVRAQRCHYTCRTVCMGTAAFLCLASWDMMKHIGALQWLRRV